jgi:heavy metal translocating P-type ATPase
MLFEVSILFAGYIGFRLFENNQPKGSKKTITLKKSQSLQPKSLPQEKVIKNPLEKTHNHYLQVSSAFMGVAVVRQFFYPPLALLNLSLFIYTVIPCFKKAEQSLLENKKIDSYVVNVLINILCLAIGQYAAAALDIFFYHVSQKVITKIRDDSEKMLADVFEQQPHSVWILKNGVEIETPLDAVNCGDIVVVNTGEVIPVDGIIIQGSALIEQHALTGESQPAEKIIGDKVFASTILVAGKVNLQVEKTGNETVIAKIGEILNNTTAFKSSTQVRGEEWAHKSAIPVLAIAGCTLFFSDLQKALAALYTNFGDGIRLLGPLGTLNYLKLASQHGIFIKDGRALEGIIKVDTIVFDKTGTLTQEQPSVGRIIVGNGYTETEVLTYAATVERKLTHPIAKAILTKAEILGLPLIEIEDSQYQIGYGVLANIENQQVRVGSLRFIEQEGILIPETLKQQMEASYLAGHSLVMVAINNTLCGMIEIQSTVRPNVKKMIKKLRTQGIKHIYIVSGDHKQPTQKLANELGVDHYFYNIFPEKKADIVEQLQKEGKTVCFVGDGVNDSIAMKKAHVSISLKGASTIATDLAQIILTEGELYKICQLFDLSTNLEANLRKSLFFSAIPGVINIGSVFLLNTGLATSIIIDLTTFFIGLENAMRPLKEPSSSKSD